MTGRTCDPTCRSTKGAQAGDELGASTATGKAGMRPRVGPLTRDVGGADVEAPLVVDAAAFALVAKRVGRLYEPSSKLKKLESRPLWGVALKPESARSDWRRTEPSR